LRESSPEGAVSELSVTEYTINAGDKVEVSIASIEGGGNFDIYFGGDAASYVTINPLDPTAPSFPTPEFPSGILAVLIPLLALAAFFANAIRIRPQTIKRYLVDFPEQV